MNLEPIVCSQCGAPLQVPAGVGFVTCNHCHASLAVRREASVTYTEAIEKLAAHTDDLREEVAELRYERELERIDREWQRRREEFLITSRRGHQSLPSTAGGIVMIVIGLVMGGAMTVFFFVIASTFGGGMAAVMAVFPLIFMAVSVLAGISMLHKAKQYQHALTDYQRRRASLRRDDLK